MLQSIVDGGSILRRLAFPPILIEASVGICITFFHQHLHAGILLFALIQASTAFVQGSWVS
jgi:hypothetical protein